MRGVLACLLVLFGISACSSQDNGANKTQKLLITGSSTLAPLVQELAKAFERQNNGVRIDVQAGGSSRGIADTRSGLAHIGMVSRAVTAAEQDLKAWPLAYDGVGIIVHQDNPLSQLSRQQVIDIYRGTINNWSELGGRGAITVIHKAEGRSTLEVFLQHFGLKNSEIQADVIIGDNEQGVKMVAGSPEAIGYVSIGTAEVDQRLGVPVKLVALDGVEANSLNVANGRFPLTRELNLVTHGDLTPLARRFIDFARSQQAQLIIQEQSFVAAAP